MQGQGWDLRLLRQCCGAPQATAARHGGTGGVQGPPRKQHHGGVAAACPSGLARVLLERHGPVEHHLRRNTGSAQHSMEGVLAQVCAGCLTAPIPQGSPSPPHCRDPQRSSPGAQTGTCQRVERSGQSCRPGHCAPHAGSPGRGNSSASTPTLLSPPQPSSPQLLFP